MKTLFTAIVAIISLSTLSQTAPGIKWQKCLGGAKSDAAASIQQTADSGYIVAGYSSSNHGVIMEVLIFG